MMVAIPEVVRAGATGSIQQTLGTLMYQNTTPQSNVPTLKVGTISMPILQKRKLRLREVMCSNGIDLLLTTPWGQSTV